MCIQSAWWSFINFADLVTTIDYNKYVEVGDVTNGLYSLSHWIFAAQYLRTSFLLPDMLKQSLMKF